MKLISEELTHHEQIPTQVPACLHASLLSLTAWYFRQHTVIQRKEELENTPNTQEFKLMKEILENCLSLKWTSDK